VGVSSKDSTSCYVCGERAPTEESHFIRGHWLVCPTCLDSLRPLFQGSSAGDEWPLWLAQADEYLAVASEMMEAGRYHLAIYFSHQAMELGVKALLIQQDRARGKRGTYSIFVLLKMASEIDERFSRFGSKPGAWTHYTISRGTLLGKLPSCPAIFLMIGKRLKRRLKLPDRFWKTYGL
jgi:HEPN domain-containing protein